MLPCLAIGASELHAQACVALSSDRGGASSFLVGLEASRDRRALSARLGKAGERLLFGGSVAATNHHRAGGLGFEVGGDLGLIYAMSPALFACPMGGVGYAQLSESGPVVLRGSAEVALGRVISPNERVQYVPFAALGIARDENLVVVVEDILLPAGAPPAEHRYESTSYGFVTAGLGIALRERLLVRPLVADAAWQTIPASHAPCRNLSKPQQVAQLRLICLTLGESRVRRPSTSQSPETQYDIVDRTGVLVARLRLPRNQSVAGFGKGVVYIDTVDEDGLHRLSKHPWPN